MGRVARVLYRHASGPYGGPQGGSGHNQSPRAAHWVRLIGRDFWHMHHYCYALRDLHRASDPRLEPRDRTFLYTRATGDLNYVLRNTKASMPLKPEVLLKLGDTQLTLGNLSGAQNAVDKARALKPDYWPAYTHWTDSLIELKQASTAQTLTEEGLRQMPYNIELRERAAKLGLRLAASAGSKTGAASSAEATQ